jgi:RNA polymerase-binding protein DksA
MDMALMTQSRPRSRRPKNEPLPAQAVPSVFSRSLLRRELTRQRALLLADWNLSFTPQADRAHLADPADQASRDLEHDLFVQLRTRVLTKLKRIERALLLLRTKHYGYCRRCHKAIPDERLAVQPDARFCVPCLKLIESRALRN